jgi:hypothetical protein
MTDDQDKLRQAEEWIMTAKVGSEQWKAAWEHVRYLLGMEPRIPSPAPSPSLVAKSQDIANIAIKRYLDERGSV